MISSSDFDVEGFSVDIFSYFKEDLWGSIFDFSESTGVGSWSNVLGFNENSDAGSFRFFCSDLFNKSLLSP